MPGSRAYFYCMLDIIRQRKEGEPKIISNGDHHIFSEGKIGAIVHYPVLVDKGSGYVSMTFEKFVRPPGTRIIAIKDNAIYLQKELRIETEGFDWRLPGGKVFDRFEEYKPYIVTEVYKDIILAAAAKELQEEAQLESSDMRIFMKKGCGATVKWDLYYIVANNVIDHHGVHDHDEGEEIEEYRFVPFNEIKGMCESGKIGEGRTVSALLSFLSQ
jgi:ADP-ribose pyrophosphatase